MEISKIKIGEVNCSIVAFAAVVNLFALTIRRRSPVRKIPPRRTYLLIRKCICAAFMYIAITQEARILLAPAITRGFQGMILIKIPPRLQRVAQMDISMIPRFCLVTVILFRLPYGKKNPAGFACQENLLIT